MHRSLIVTADDFGASLEVNEAVVRAYRDGILRFASLMVAEPAAQDAVDRARKECPGLGLGLHVSLCSGRSVLGPDKAPGLVGGDGRFSDDSVRCGLRYFFDRSLQAPLELEMRAQFERFLSWGLRPTHVDGHVNLHVHPVVFPILMRLVREYGVRRVRLPGGELRHGLAFNGFGGVHWPEAVALGWLRRYLTRAWGDPRVEIPDRVYGVLRSGVMSEEYVLACLRNLPPGTTEMYFHPSADPATVATDGPVPTHRSFSELQTLLSAKVRRAIDSGGIILANP